jgi:hypothetical protein
MVDRMNEDGDQGLCRLRRVLASKGRDISRELDGDARDRREIRADRMEA